MEIAEAGKGHLIVGSIFALLSLAAAVVLAVTQTKAIGAMSALGFAAYFFGVWGGVEIGRYIEARRAESRG
jgi:hypothetical protein